MADLAFMKYPFDKDQVNLVLYNRPEMPVSPESQPSTVADEIENPPVENEIWISRTLSERRAYPGDGYPGDAYTGQFGGDRDIGFGGGSGFRAGDGGFEGHDFSGGSDSGGFGFSHGAGFDVRHTGYDGGGHHRENHANDKLTIMAEERKRYFDHLRHNTYPL